VDGDVIMTGAVGLAGIGYAWWNRWVSLLHDRTLSDLAAVRDVIEEGAIYLHRVSYAFDRARREMNDDVERAHAALVEIGPTYDEISERLKVRLAPHHEVAQKFAGAVEAGLDAARAIERLAVLHLPSIAMGGGRGEAGDGARRQGPGRPRAGPLAFRRASQRVPRRCRADGRGKAPIALTSGR
jgi:hypothetical protein